MVAITPRTTLQKQRLLKNSTEAGLKNQAKAISEHRNKHQSQKENPYISGTDLSTKEFASPGPGPLSLTHHCAAAQGRREKMEDAHFYEEMGSGTLIGLFDGHGGDKVAKLAANIFSEVFPERLGQNNRNVRKTFEDVFNLIQRGAIKHNSWKKIGSTAVVCYIDKKTHQIYTATLGDSEANIYRRTPTGKLESIPLSCVRDWLSKRDRARLEKIYGKAKVEKRVRAKKGNSKHIRSRVDGGVNNSRSLGDHYYAFKDGNPLVIQKPKITAYKIKDGDLLTLACDGLKDFVNEQEIVQLIDDANQFSIKPIAESLVDKALSNMTDKRHDNVSIVAVKAQVSIDTKITERRAWSWYMLYAIYNFFQKFIWRKETSPTSCILS